MNLWRVKAGGGDCLRRDQLEVGVSPKVSQWGLLNSNDQLGVKGEFSFNRKQLKAVAK